MLELPFFPSRDCILDRNKSHALHVVDASGLESKCKYREALQKGQFEGWVRTKEAISRACSANPVALASAVGASLREVTGRLYRQLKVSAVFARSGGQANK